MHRPLDLATAMDAHSPNHDLSAARTFRFVAAAGLQYRAPEFLIDGLIETDSLGLLFGEPGCGKSFLAVDIALCVATGAAFHGRGVKGGPVFLIAGEGHNGLARRFAAWAIARGVSLNDALLFKSNRAAQFLDAANARIVAEAVEALAGLHGKPALIIIDTLARNFGAGDENSTSDMGSFITAVDDLKARFPGCAVLIVHHSGHADKSRARGAMALKGALDCEYRVEKDADAIRLINTKMKDAEPPRDLHFALKSVDLADGATSAVLEETDAPDRSSIPSPTHKMAMQTFISASVAHGRWDRAGFAGLHVSDWRDPFYARHTGDNTEAKKKAFQRARRDLVTAGQLTVINGVYLTSNQDVIDEISMARASGTTGTYRDIVPECPDVEAQDAGTTGTRAYKPVPCPVPTNINSEDYQCARCAGEGCRWCDEVEQ